MKKDGIIFWKLKDKMIRIIKKGDDKSLKWYSLYCNPIKDNIWIDTLGPVDNWLNKHSNEIVAFDTVQEFTEYVLRMMYYNHALIEFMKAKAKKIEALTGIKDYFTEEDELEMISWGIDELDDVYRILVDNILEYNVSGLYSYVCPFCIKYNSKCSICGYGKRHGKCSSYSDESNTWKEVMDNLNDEDEIIFSNEFYRAVIGC